MGKNPFSVSVKRLPESDSGRFLVRLNEKYRSGIPRWGIGRLTNSKENKSALVLFLGHDDDKNIYMPYDIRVELGLPINDDKHEFEVQKSNVLDCLWWYLSSKDPAVKIPAWLAVLGVCVGLVSVAPSISGIGMASYFGIVELITKIF